MIKKDTNKPLIRFLTFSLTALAIAVIVFVIQSFYSKGSLDPTDILALCTAIAIFVIVFLIIGFVGFKLIKGAK